jgi:hypothetical protein
METPRLISDEYRRTQEELHKNPKYGTASVNVAPIVANVIRGNKVNELLDYGAGKGRLGQELKKMGACPPRLHHYDPAVPAWAATPAPAEMVACIDVLEHIEPEYLDNVLDDLQRVTRRIGVFSVATKPAQKVLPDGRNAHLIQEGPGWWLPRFLTRFELEKFDKMYDGFIIAVTPLKSAGARA